MFLRFLFVLIFSTVYHCAFSEKVYSSVNPLRMQAQSPQCTSDDLSRWQSSTSQNTKLFNDIRTCTEESGGSTDITASVSACLRNLHPDLSQSCAECFGSDVDCGATNCRVPCAEEANSSQCQECLTPCTNALQACAGTSNLPQEKSASSSGVISSGGVTGMIAGLVVSTLIFH